MIVFWGSAYIHIGTHKIPMYAQLADYNKQKQFKGINTEVA